MTDSNIEQAKTLYKSPKSVRKGLSLRDMFPRKAIPTHELMDSDRHPIRMLVSIRPGLWQRIGESFEEFEHALERAADFERQGYRVKVLDVS